MVSFKIVSYAPFMSFFGQKNQNILSDGKIRKFDEERVFFSRKKSSQF